jgi:hypothetical protein
MDVSRSMQGTVEEQMFHNRRTLHDITKMKQDSICNEVTYLLFFLLFVYHISNIYSFGCRISCLHQKLQYMSYNQIACGGIWHTTSVTKCVASKMISIIVVIVPVLPIKQHLGKNSIQFC